MYPLAKKLQEHVATLRRNPTDAKNITASFYAISQSLRQRRITNVCSVLFCGKVPFLHIFSFQNHKWDSSLPFSFDILFLSSVCSCRKLRQHHVSSGYILDCILFWRPVFFCWGTPHLPALSTWIVTMVTSEFAVNNCFVKTFSESFLFVSWIKNYRSIKFRIDKGRFPTSVFGALLWFDLQRFLILYGNASGADFVLMKFPLQKNFTYPCLAENLTGWNGVLLSTVFS